MELYRFKEISGAYVEEIIGQSRIGYSMSDTVDFYDMIEISKRGDYRGSVILFHDYKNGQVYKPFKVRQNVIYGNPMYARNYFWFLQGDYNKKQITLFRYIPHGLPEPITQLAMDKVNLYNLRLTGEDIHITSEDDDFKCYYPETFTLSKNSKEGAEMIANGNVYFSSWVEEGWDQENNCPSDNYQYYNKVVVKDFSGNIISEEVGSLQQRWDGTWWIS